MKRNVYPFSAITGMEKAKKAILINLVNPHAGGLIISGKSGSGKSTLVRGARDLIDDPWVELPVSVTEDRLLGSIDTEKAVKTGERTLLPGLVDEANEGILYIDDVNLLQSDLLSIVLDIQQNGSYKLERDGLSVERKSRFTILSVMNPDGGSLPSSALDRFGLFVNIEGTEGIKDREEIIRRVLAYENDGIGFRNKWADANSVLREKIRNAREILPEVECPDAMIQLAAVYSLKANVSGHRADIYLIEAAKAIAALYNRMFIMPKDIEEAAEFVLPHRMRKPDMERNNTPQTEQNKEQEQEKEDRPENNEQQAPKNEDLRPAQLNDTQDESNDDSEPEDNTENAPAPREDQVDQADLSVVPPPMWIQPQRLRLKKSGDGKREFVLTDKKQGRYVKSKLPREKVSDIAFDATLRAAAPYQKARHLLNKDLAFVIKSRDLRDKVREKRTGHVFLFVVDASGSMGAKKRMSIVKGVIFKMLLEAYQKRDRVGMIAFRKKKAEVLLPITRSVEFAQKKLADLPTGGKTPLASGLRKAEDVLDMLYRQEPTQEPVVILITDGRATAGSNPDSDPVADALREGARLRRRNLPIAVIDTESGYIRLGLAEKLANIMGASYFHVDKLSEDSLLHIWRTTTED